MSQSRLAHKAVLLTGGASGIGLGIAELFLSEGANVYIADFSEQNIDSAQKHLLSRFPQERFFLAQADVGIEETVRNTIQSCVDKFGSLDIAILNAGIFPPPKPLLEYDVTTYDQCMRVNAFGSFIGVQLAAKKMIELKTAGSIVLTCSAAGLQASPNTAPYTMSKYAIRGLTMSAGQKLAQHGIRVNCICPGIIDTPAARQHEALAAVASATPFKRFGMASEVANAFLFLSSSKSSFVTGAYLKVDGGLVNS